MTNELYELCEHGCGKHAIKSGSNGYECRNYANYGDCKGLQPRTSDKTQSRNEICNCDSGKKFKNCCLKIKR